MPFSPYSGSPSVADLLRPERRDSSPGAPPPAHVPATTAADTDVIARLADDPWSVTRVERRALRARHEASQRRWLARLRDLVEPPAPADSFPAFLLDLPPFHRLGRSVGDARAMAALDVGTADELQRFVDRYRTYLDDAV